MPGYSGLLYITLIALNVGPYAFQQCKNKTQFHFYIQKAFSEFYTILEIFALESLVCEYYGFYHGGRYLFTQLVGNTMTQA